VARGGDGRRIKKSAPETCVPLPRLVRSGRMKQVLRYRGRGVSEADVVFIRDLIERNPRAGRRKLSRLLCEAWEWRQPNGAPRDMICRGLMLALYRAGRIELPPPRPGVLNNLAGARRPAPVCVDTSPIDGTLDELEPLTWVQVRRRAEEPLFDGLIQQYHYLGYRRPVGEHLKFMVFSRRMRPVACLAFGSAPRHLGPRDQFIGWTAEARRRNIRFVAKAEALRTRPPRRRRLHRRAQGVRRARDAQGRRALPGLQEGQALRTT